MNFGTLVISQLVVVDSLSPYLFLFVADALSLLLKDAYVRENFMISICVDKLLIFHIYCLQTTISYFLKGPLIKHCLLKRFWLVVMKVLENY